MFLWAAWRHLLRPRASVHPPGVCQCESHIQVPFPVQWTGRVAEPRGGLVPLFLLQQQPIRLVSIPPVGRICPELPAEAIYRVLRSFQFILGFQSPLFPWSVECSDSSAADHWIQWSRDRKKKEWRVLTRKWWASCRMKHRGLQWSLDEEERRENEWGYLKTLRACPVSMTSFGEVISLNICDDDSDIRCCFGTTFSLMFH